VGARKLVAIGAIALALAAGAAGVAYTDFGSRVARSLSMTFAFGDDGRMRGHGFEEGRSAGRRLQERGPERRGGGERAEGRGIEEGAFLSVAGYGGVLVGAAVLTALAAWGAGALAARARSSRRDA